MLSLKPITTCHLEFVLKILWMQHFSQIKFKKKKFFLDPKNEGIVKML